MRAPPRPPPAHALTGWPTHPAGRTAASHRHASAGTTRRGRLGPWRLASPRRGNGWGDRRRLERALRELLAGRAPQRSVVVAVIDGGIDTVHRYLAPTLWKNPREVAGNGRDDDNNGFVDDVFGWNFSVMANGESVHHDTFEVT